MSKISIVVSVYNEEKVLPLFYEAFQKEKENFSWDYELIFVNDGSQDTSLDLLDGFAKEEEHIKIISFTRNFGHEAAMIAGIDYATGDGVICMDADLQHPLSCIPEIIRKLEEGYDVVNMVRISNKSAGLLKNITSKLFYKFINLLSDQTKFENNSSDFFAINRKIANVLHNNYREKMRFLRGYVQNIGGKQTTLSYEAARRAGGKSHYGINKLMKLAVSSIVLFSNFPLKVGIYAGGLSALFGLIVLIYTLCTYPGAPSGYATIVVLICFLFAALFIIIGIIGEYIAILFAELKDRPIYIVDETVNF